jgi:lipid II:glycine glycyltransferase (peptidoglycan interpeptide bridge formation enzyme)
MPDIRQSSQFDQFMKDLHWQIKKIDGQYIYLRKFPFIGYFAKIPRLVFPYNFKELSVFVKRNRIFKLKIAPFVYEGDINYKKYKDKLLSFGLKIDNEPFNPTTTIYIDLLQPENKIFQKFSEAKRRAVRKALKNNVSIIVSDDYHAFVDIRKKQFSPMGFLITNEMKKLWENFFPENAKLLLAFHNKIPVAGIFLLFYDHIAYYWYASALNYGKKLFAPSLLVWEALKLSKKEGCKIFDFEGIYDSRFPKAGESWKGFTKFKEGFGGEKKVLIENFTS